MNQINSLIDGGFIQLSNSSCLSDPFKASSLYNSFVLEILSLSTIPKKNFGERGVTHGGMEVESNSQTNFLGFKNTGRILFYSVHLSKQRESLYHIYLSLSKLAIQRLRSQTQSFSTTNWSPHPLTESLKHISITHKKISPSSFKFPLFSTSLEIFQNTQQLCHLMSRYLVFFKSMRALESPA